jgi:L-lactate dehydrogenase
MSKSRFEPAKIAIIGAGKVGATTAYGLLLSSLATAIVLVDVDRSKAEGEVMDLNHSGPFGPPTRIFAGNYGDCAGAAITIIAAGRSQRSGETRLDLNESNALILREIIPQVVRNNADGILLIATNPVDVLTYASWKLSGFPPNRVIGSGTILDTARFRYLLGQHFGIDPQSVHAYIIGEHGDSEVPVWSLANIAGIRLREFCEHKGCPTTSGRCNPSSARRGMPPMKSSGGRVQPPTHWRPPWYGSSKQSYEMRTRSSPFPA